MKAGPATYKAGATVITEGEVGQEMFVVESGTVEVFRGTGSKARKLSLLGAGDFFGETALLDGLPHGASARAATDCQLLALDAATFDELLRTHPETAAHLLRGLAARLRAESARADQAESAQEAKPPAAPAPPAPAPAKAAPKAASPAPAAGTRARTLTPPQGDPIPVPDKDDVRLGRFDSASGLTPDIELGPLDTKHLTSRRHARLVREKGATFVVEDTATANGTFVNGTRIAAGVKTPVHDGDTLRFGGIDLVYSGD
jgi:pyruvate/2-oxoglutarate dehydrogenase complex dihydrolipoamide acyltransferase (E2) component